MNGSTYLNIRMPSHGATIIDGIPVIVKDSTMFAFQSGSATIRLGTYDSTTNKAVWDLKPDSAAWLASYRQSLVARSRK